MLFTDWKILLGILIGWLIYYLPAMYRYQISLLVTGSLAIYAYEAPTVVTLLLTSALLNAYISYWVIRSQNNILRIKIATLGVFLNISLLAFFKYNRLLYDLIGSEIAADGNLIHTLLLLPLPIGISFYTFHGISLLIDTLRTRRVRESNILWGGINPNRPFRFHLKDTLLYLCFFPQLVAGPITKANFFYPQIKSKFCADIDWKKVFNSLVVGYFLKLVVANNLANLTFNIQYPYFIGMAKNDLILLLFGYSMQIFADFAGYSLIAIGLAALFGYKLPDNFNFPYISKSFSEFWTRWHISLSSWLKEYLYFSLGGNRKGNVRTYFNLMIVMILGGLWHGAGISYAVWGAWHGTALVVERFLNRNIKLSLNNKIVSLVKMVIVFTVVTVGWLLFKLPEFDHFLAYIEAIVTSDWQIGLSNTSRAVIFLSLPIMLYHLSYVLQFHGYKLETLRQPALGFMSFMIILNTGPNAPFIYFQF